MRTFPNLFRPDEAEEHVYMTDWSFREVWVPAIGGETVHLVGIVDRLGRVCSPVQEFDPDTMTAITRSGKKYTLVGDPGYNEDAEYVFNHWCHLNRITQVEKVTDRYFSVQDDDDDNEGCYS